MPPPSVAIIGTRDPERYQIKAAEMVSWKLSRHFDCRIRTGGAAGIDFHAMIACKKGMLQVYVPWEGFHADLIPHHAEVVVYNPHIHTAWTKSLDLHPAPRKLGESARCLHARNYGIVHGADLVLAFPRRDGGGGTGQGIRLAEVMGIPKIIRPSFSEFSLNELWLQTLSFARIIPF